MNNYTQSQIRELAEYITGENFWYAAQMRFSDGPAGLRAQDGKGDSMGLKKSRPATSFLSHSALACTFDRALSKKVGECIGAEAANAGVDILLAPAVNVKRCPLNGRNFEYFSEDPYLSGELAAAYIEGVQSCGVGACVKHFAANNKELGRSVSNSLMSVRTLREVYLAPFERAVKSSPAAVMTSYNKINGVYCSQNGPLIEGILRGEWGFKGFTVSDWGGVYDRPASIRAGLDLEMPASAFSADEICAAFERGEITFEQLSACAQRLKEAKARFSAPKKSFDISSHSAFARKCAAECAVLLKNDGVLPLNGQKTALFGRECKYSPVQGGGSSKVTHKNRPQSLLDLFKNAGNFVGYSKNYSGKLIKKCQVALVCVYAGGDSEGNDKTTLTLPQKQLKLIEKLKKSGKKVVCVLVGGAVDTSFDKGLSALLYTGLSGEGFAGGIYDVLTGAVCPSARLSETFFNDPSELSTVKNFNRSPYFVTYDEGLAVGYRYYFANGIEPKYPFGFGLSYTEFSLYNFKASQSGVELTVKNTGKCGGAHALQLYAKFPAGANCPFPVLIGFEKVFLKAGEERGIKIPVEGLRSFDAEKNRFVTVGGKYTLYIGENCFKPVLSAEIEVEGVPSVSDGEIPENSPYPLKLNKKGRIIAGPDTPFCELTNSCRATVRLFARGALYFTRNNPTVGGTLRYTSVRTISQFAGFNTRQMEGFLQILNGKYFKGLYKIATKNKRPKNKR